MSTVSLDPVVRMFTSELGTVRWETRIAGVQGLEFTVSGPETWSSSSVFPDAMTLLRYQSEYERFLRDSGYALCLVNDRRSRTDRRQQMRLDQDRRR